ERVASNAVGRPVHFTRGFSVSWSLSPLFTANGVVVDNPDWVGTPHLAEVDSVAVRIKLLPLLKGQMILPEITLNRPNVDMLRQASGRANWEDEADSKTPTHLPVINRFTVSVGNIKLTDDKRKLSFNGKFSAEELQNGAHSLAITGDGAL